MTPISGRDFGSRILNDLESLLRRNARDKYTYRELKDFADRIRDRLKQSPYVAQIDEVGGRTSGCGCRIPGNG